MRLGVAGLGPLPVLDGLPLVVNCRCPTSTPTLLQLSQVRPVLRRYAYLGPVDPQSDGIAVRTEVNELTLSLT